MTVIVFLTPFTYRDDPLALFYATLFELQVFVWPTFAVGADLF